MKTTVFKTVVFASTLVFATPLVAQVTTVPNKGPGFKNIILEDQGFGFPGSGTSKKEKPKSTDSKISELKEIDLKKSFLTRGGINGGGGDDLALEFKSYAYAGLDELKRRLPKVYDKIDGDSIAEVIKHANIFVVDEALDVQVKELIQNSVAFNSPEQNVILLNRKRLETIQNQQLLNSIAVHEVLSLKEIERTGYYPISGQLARVQGQSEQTLSTVLQVNRLKQIQALSPTATKYEVLRKLFDESQDRISLSELDTEAALYAGKAKWKCYMAKEYSPNEAIATSLTLVTVTIKPGVPGEPSSGPLFPEKPSIPPRKEIRPVTIWGHYINKKVGFYDDGSHKGTRVTVSENQILEELSEAVGPYLFGIRKNGQYITYYYPHTGSVGYCYKN